MGLACGIVGLPNVGKTTIYDAITLTESACRTPYMFSTKEPARAAVNVPDPRLARIAEYIPPEKIIPAQIMVVDIPALIHGSAEGEGMGNTFLGAIKEADMLLHVIRCFTNDNVQHVSGSVDPVVDAEIVALELMHTDLGTVTRNLERVSKKARAGDKDALAQKAAFEKAKACLEADKLLRLIEFTGQERELLRPLFLLTIKPVLFIANVGDDDLEGKSEHVIALQDYAARTNAEVLHLCGDLEAEFVRMDEEDRQTFMAEMSFKESGLDRLIHKAFDMLGLQTFFTAGDKQVRAWVIHKGDTAPVGAGNVHTDFQKKFIRVEVYSFEDLMELHSEAAIKAAGKMRLEGKDYVLQEGDVCHFLIGS
ncbi:MAG: redox-regulated ATPase YchF [Planctomycetota bacterium]|jgi:GTP-binding protein YchF